MKLTFKLKNSEKQKKYEELFPNFRELLNKSCEVQWEDSSDYIVVSNDDFGCDKYYDVRFRKSEIVQGVQLELCKWYDREHFDGNPNGYILIENDKDGCLTVTKCANRELWPDTEKFMYIENYK